MALFVGHPRYREKGNINVTYTAPSVFVEANDEKLATEMIKHKSGLSRFPEWTFFVVKAFIQPRNNENRKRQ